MVIPFSVFAQEESLSELTARLDRENLERAQQIQEGQTPQSSFQKADCFPWQTEVARSGGGIECVGSGLEISGDQGLYIGIGFLVVIIIIAVAISASKKGKSEQVQERRGWTRKEQQAVLDGQNGKCADCGQHASSFQFDHRDGNHSNNSLSNCQALCPNCHDRKSRGLD